MKLYEAKHPKKIRRAREKNIRKEDPLNPSLATLPWFLNTLFIASNITSTTIPHTHTHARTLADAEKNLFCCEMKNEKKIKMEKLTQMRAPFFCKAVWRDQKEIILQTKRFNLLANSLCDEDKRV